MANRINSKLDLPKWFDLQKYSVFTHLKDEEKLDQIWHRINIILGEKANHKSFVHTRISDSSHYNCIIKGDPILKAADIKITAGQSGDDLSDKLIDAPEQDSSLFIFGDDQTINPLTIKKALRIGQIAKKLEAEIIENKPTFSKFAYGNVSFNAASSKSHDSSQYSNISKEILVSINLKNQTNKEIIREFEEMIDSWREALQAPEPTRPNIRANHLQNIISYKLFPLFDLTLWEMVNECSIKNSVLAIALFPDGFKGERELRDTVIPFMNEVFTPSYLIEQWNYKR